MLLLALPLLLELGLPLSLGLVALLLVDLLLPRGLLLGPLPNQYLLLVELLLGDLLLQLLPGLGLHLLSLLLLGPLIVHLLYLLGPFSRPLLILVAFLLDGLLALLQGLELLQLGVERVLQPLLLDLLSLHELLPLHLQPVALHGQDRSPGDAGVPGHHLDLLAVCLAGVPLVCHDLLPGPAGRGEEVPPLSLEEVVAQLH
mmetsp:Transcript_117767/g.329784  ORF Transcript_117767/g.329784 Transcript_117767/m.329784 type:complete len:201 (+) Transcript_117767:384-986(+)